MKISIAIQKNSIIFASSKKGKQTMKYNELEKRLKKAGCYDTKTTRAGHPLWYSPKTGKYFTMSHHGSQEVKPGTLKSIMRDAGLE